MDSKSRPTSYAAPNTPIASSKRLKVNPTITSPKIVPNLSTIHQTPEKHHSENAYESTTPEDTSEMARKNAIKAKQHVRPVEAYTPSKNMFSPMLRTDEHHSLHHSHSNDNSVRRLSTSLETTEEEAGDSSGDFAVSRTNSCEISPNKQDNNSVESSTPLKQSPQQQEEEMYDNSINNNNDNEEQEDEEEEDVFNPYHFIAHLPHYNTVCEQRVVLPPLNTASNSTTSNTSSNKVKPTLVLDLDETLVHCTVECIDKPDLVFPVQFNGMSYQVYARKRPYLDYFLETVSKSFEVVVFTASQRVYADILLDKLDPQRQYIDHRLFRESCLLVEGNYLKDLHVLGRNMSKTILVDNSPHAYAYQIDNGIPIESWYDDDNDSELLKLIGFLKHLQTKDDVRPVVREHFKTYQLVSRAKSGLPISLSAPPF